MIKAACFTAQTLVLVAVALVGKAISAELPAVAHPRVDVQHLDYGLKASPLGGSWYVIAGENADLSIANGCNIINTGFYVGTDRVWVINTGVSKAYGAQQKALIDRTSGGKPIEQVLALNLHPDYLFGNQAYAADVLAATPLTMAGIAREGKAYEDNLFKLCGDWMKGTQTVVPTQTLRPNSLKGFGGKPLQVMELKGHTDSDLVVFDPDTGVLWAGGLVFYQRIVTTPHANIQPWIESLKALRALNPKLVVPSHGPLSAGVVAIEQTLDYLGWLDRHLKESARDGLTLNELMAMGAPARFRGFAAYPAEFNRNLSNLYPAYEKAALVSP